MDISEMLKKNKIKVTKNRIDIIKYFYDNEKFVTINEIQNELKIELSIIYRNIKLFLDKGIIIKELRNDMKQYYMLNNHKHFLQCSKCHTIQKLDVCPFKKNFEKELNKKFGFKMTKHDIYLLGICKNCVKNSD